MPSPKSTLQTLERGIHVLELAASKPHGITMAEIAEKLDVHRAIAYRIVSTLEEKGLVHRPGDNRVYLGSGILRFSERFLPQLRHLAQPILDELSHESGMTAFLSVAQGHECTAVAVSEMMGGVLGVTYHIGSRHPLNLGAAGVAILANRAPSPNDHPHVLKARKVGYSLTDSQIQKGATGLATSLDLNNLEASLGVVTMNELNESLIAPMVKSHGEQLKERLTQA